MQVIAVTQARMGSTRFPGKILQKVAGVSLLEIHIQRIRRSRNISQLVLATTTRPEDDAVENLGQQLGISTYRGSENDVLDRFYNATAGLGADLVVRLTSDCPLIDADLIDKVIDHTLSNGLDYCSNTLDPKYPDGQDVEVFRFSALDRAWQEATLPSDREHVTPYIWRNSSYKGGKLFASGNFEEGLSFGSQRMTVDEPDDLEVIRALIDKLGLEKTWLEYAQYLEAHPDIRNLNASINRNEGYTSSINKEKKL